jgi:AcrR family transcriptional regulator
MARPKGDIEPRILASARKRFLSDGVDGASLRSIATDAGTSIGMVYYYFPTKDDLFFGVVEQLYRQLLGELEKALTPDVPVRERIARVYERVARLTDDELMMLRLVVREALTSNTRFERLRERFQSGHLPLIARLVGDGFQSGAFDRNLHPMVVMMAIGSIGIAPQMIRRAMDGRLPFPGAPAGTELSRLLVDVLFSGTGAKPEK